MTMNCAAGEGVDIFRDSPNASNAGHSRRRYHPSTETFTLRGIERRPRTRDDRLRMIEDTVEFFNLALDTHHSTQEKMDLVADLR